MNEVNTELIYEVLNKFIYKNVGMGTEVSMLNEKYIF